MTPARPHPSATAERRTPRKKARSRTPARPALSRAVILHAAMDCAKGAPEVPSLAVIGRALDVDPTAVYRHYLSKHDLLVDMAEIVYAEVRADVEALPELPVREELEAAWWILRRSYLRYPGLAIVMAPRFTGGPNEQHLIDRATAALCRHGLPQPEAEIHTRALATTTLGYVVIAATLATLSPQDQLEDVRIGQRAYPDAFGDASEAGDVLQAEHAVFAAAIEAQLDGVDGLAERHRATTSPRPQRTDAP